MLVTICEDVCKGGWGSTVMDSDSELICLEGIDESGANVTWSKQKLK